MSRKMATGTIRKRVISKKNLVLIGLIIFVNQAFSQTDNCQVHAVGFEVLSKDYAQFSSVLDSYYESEYSYDLIILKIKGGNPSKSYVLRYYSDGNWNGYSETGDGSKDTFRVIPDSTLINDLKSVREFGDFMEICPLSSSNNTYVYMIKRDGEVYVKYQSNYPVFSERKEINEFKRFIEKLKQLQN